MEYNISLLKKDLVGFSDDALVLIDGNSIMNRAFYGIMGSKALTTKEAKKVPLAMVIKNPGVWIPSICQFGSNFAYGALFAFVPILFESVQASGLSHYYMAYAISVILTRVLIGRILN